MESYRSETRTGLMEQYSENDQMRPRKNVIQNRLQKALVTVFHRNIPLQYLLCPHWLLDTVEDVSLYTVAYQQRAYLLIFLAVPTNVSCCAVLKQLSLHEIFRIALSL